MQKFISKYKGYFFIILLAFLTLRVFIPQLDDLKESISALKDANLYWMLAGLVIYFIGVPPVMAIQFVALAFKRITYTLTLKVEMAGLFVGKLLPNGVGSISLNMFYFIKKKHTPSEASSVMTMDAITSAIAYTFLIIIALLASTISLKGITDAVDLPDNLILFLVILLLGIAYFIHRSISLRIRLRKIWLDFISNFAMYKKRPKSVFISIFGNGLSSIASLFALYAAAHSVGVGISFAEALLAYTFGNIAATLIPTPGGIGAVEAGVYSGLVMTGVNGSDAIVITLLFRLITYWIPLVVGYYFFWSLRKTLLSSFSIRKSYDS